MRLCVGWLLREVHLVLRIPQLFVGRPHCATGESIGIRPVRIGCSCGRVFYEREARHG